MKFSNIPVPEVYKESADFRFFLKWFELALSKIKYDTENMVDLYDPLRCRSELLWMLADTMGYKFDDRLPTAFNRLVLLYFMSMIRHKGSKNGVTLAAEVNLAQFSLINYGKEKEILYDRLDDTSIPVNSVYVTPNVKAGYIDVVYFSENKPVDACIEYVRPLGMYCFQSAGVRVDARTKISVDARLTNTNDMNISIGPTHVGHYSRSDYASMQKTLYNVSTGRNDNDSSHVRKPVYYRNSVAEKQKDERINPGYRALSSLQLSNNEHIVKSLIPDKVTGELVERDPIFSLGYGPHDVNVTYSDSYLKENDGPEYNLRYDRELDESITPNVYTVESGTVVNPRPAVNKPMASLGDAMSTSNKVN